MKGKWIEKMARTAAALMFVGAMLLLSQAHGAVFFAGKFNDKGEFVPNADVKGPCFGVKYYTVSTEVTNGRAQTKIEVEIAGQAKEPVTTVCIVPLPKNVERDGLSWDVPDGPVKAKYLAADEAEKVYESIAKAIGSARVVALSGRPALMFSDFTLGQKAKLTLELRQAISETGGLCEYECPMPETGFAVGPVARLTVNATVRDKMPLRAIFSPTHEVAVERKGLSEAVVRVAADNWFGGGMFRLLYVADESPLGLRVITHREEGEAEGYFMVIGNPTGSAKPEKAIEKDVLLALDTSGSMRGEKMEQARSAIEYCLKNLNPGDRFNIITFGTDVKLFRDEVVGKTEKNLRAAGDFVDEIVAVGRTNISGALAKGLAGTPEKGRPRIMIFLTDGTPTAGELVPENIIKQLAEANTSKTRIFVMGVGNDVNAQLLDRLAEDTDGSSEYVAPDEEIDMKVAGLYNQLSHPVLTNVQLSFGEGRLMTNSVYPKKVPALFRGSQIMIAGRYRGGGKHTVTISGVLAGDPKAYHCEAVFAEKKAPENEYVAPLWAARKIGFLLQEIRLHGENQELIEEVVRLSKKFGIVTEYTEFVAMSGKDMSEKEIVEEAKKRLTEAHGEASGQWAVNQAKNDQEMQQRAAAAPSSNVYRDKRGNMVEAQNVKQVGRQAFYLRDGKWEDADAAGDRKVRTVKLFSKEYFDLVRGNKDFREAQSVGPNLSINVGSERIVVEKETPEPKDREEKK